MNTWRKNFVALVVFYSPSIPVPLQGPACTQQETGCLADLPLSTLLKPELLALPIDEYWKSPSQETLNSSFPGQLIPMWFGQADHSLWEISKVKAPVAALPINQCVFYRLCVTSTTHHMSPTPEAKEFSYCCVWGGCVLKYLDFCIVFLPGKSVHANSIVKNFPSDSCWNSTCADH